jgi:competence protein ComEC
LLEKGHKILRLEESLNLASVAKIEILWPNKKAACYEQLSGNDESLVSLIQFGDVKILLCSDIEKFAQAELLGLYPDLKADVVVVPHHGSVKTTERHFLEKLNADILIVSCSQKDHERQQAVRAENETKLFYTARDGAITICVKRDGTIKLR